ncbi:hypothetical protein [Bremerella sp. P1]|uniref:hypothetical protein n=1 Tax=Bremerella sp. P1 TaxID=3026424 RepID=UPI002367923F|nr:hypothetical protein [Bremerella sp. P1]WDI44766.1 hypothetical protein PSR63_12550 [Bremerella sp. P1]
MPISVGYLPAGVVGDTLDLAHMAGERASQQQAAQRIEQQQLAYAQLAQQYNLAQQGRYDNYAAQASKLQENARYRDFLQQRDQANNEARAQLEGFQQQQANQRAAAVTSRMQGTQAAQMMSQQAGQMRTQSNQQFAQLQQAASQGDASASSLVSDYQKHMQGAQRAYNNISRKYSHDPAKLAQASMALEQKRAEWMGNNYQQWKGSQPLPIEQQIMQQRYSPDGMYQSGADGKSVITPWAERKQKQIETARESHISRQRDMPQAHKVSVKVSGGIGEDPKTDMQDVDVSSTYKELFNKQNNDLLSIDLQRAEKDYWDSMYNNLAMEGNQLERELIKAGRDPEESQAMQSHDSRLYSVFQRFQSEQEKLKGLEQEYDARDYASKLDTQYWQDMKNYQDFSGNKVIGLNQTRDNEWNTALNTSIQSTMNQPPLSPQEMPAPEMLYTFDVTSGGGFHPSPAGNTYGIGPEGQSYIQDESGGWSPSGHGYSDRGQDFYANPENVLQSLSESGVSATLRGQQPDQSTQYFE